MAVAELSMNLADIYERFPTQKDCLQHLEQMRWNGRPRCPYCASQRITKLVKQDRFHCNACNTSFGVTVGTPFQNTKTDLQRWFFVISRMLNATKPISARQLVEETGANKNTVTHMLVRLRQSMREHGDFLENLIAANHPPAPEGFRAHITSNH